MYYLECKDDLVGFSQNTEWLPNNFDKFTSKIALRKLFLTLSNNILKDFCHFNKKEKESLSKLPLKEIFEYKIKSLLPLSFVKPFTMKNSFNIDIASTKVIHHYLSKRKKQQIFVANKNLLPVARLISHCYINNEMQLLLDINLLFHEFVFQKISNLHKNKKVTDEGDSITITGHSNTPVKIYPFWKSIDKNNLNINKEVKKATKCVKDGKFCLIYLVYPKTKNFNRHIPVKVDVLENMDYKIKAIPYSLRSTLR